jgi:putative colanic acid biosynthesis UDP-glucose lipid carrier transferase
LYWQVAAFGTMSRKLNIYTIIRYLIDSPVVGLSFLFSIYVTNTKSLDQLNLTDYLFLLLSIILWYITASFSHLYTERRSNKFSEEIIFIIYTLFLYAIVFSSASFFLQKIMQLGTYFLGTMLAILFPLITITKYLIRKYLHAAIHQGRLYDNLLIIGATPSAMHFYETINRYYYYGYKCVGFVDDHQHKMNGCVYKGGIHQLPQILKQDRIDEVIIALPDNDDATIRECIEICDQYATKTRIVPDAFRFTTATTQVNNIGLLPVLSVRALPLDKIENQALKRTFDILFSLCFFVLLGSWLMPLIALAIRLTSKGPIIFKQERWGLNNEKIVCYKFRTMVHNSADIDQDGMYNQATKDDPRVTPIGALLRKTNMDELPQFWNVLLGNMSVVGPRPHPTPLNLESMHTVDNYMLRHIVLPGITGWAQVNGFRGETRKEGAMQQRVDFDLYYIHRWTFWFDCQIILQTVINIIRGDQNAY